MNSHKIILKTTGLFASLRMITILVTIGSTKLIAFLLGATGIGLYGILNSVLNLVSSFTDLGISKSSIRNISEANGEENHDKIVYTISVVSKLIFITGASGGLLTMALSYYISIWTFGNPSYWFSFVIIGLAVFFTVIKNGQTAIFQGLRKLKIITRNTVISAVLGFLLSIPLIYFFGQTGILYSILAISFIGFIVSKYFIGTLKYRVEEHKIKLTKENSWNIIKLGLSMMLVSFLVVLSGYLIRSYITVTGGLLEVGYFQAGFQIISGYFGIIFTSMTADYFPRISAINKQDDKLETEVNQQSVITLLLICPLVAVLPFAMPHLISLLYTSNFTSTVDYVNFALLGIIFQAGSQTMGMILLAKNDAKLYTLYVFCVQLIFLLISILGYKYYGIMGLGIGFSINMLVHLLSIQIICKRKYNISYSREFLLTLMIVLSFSVSSLLLKNSEGYIHHFSGLLIFVFSILFTGYRFKKILGINSLFLFVRNKFMGGKKTAA